MRLNALDNAQSMVELEIPEDLFAPYITKFTYLRSLLKGEAKLSSQGLALTSAN